MITKEEILGTSVEIDGRIATIAKRVIEAKVPEGTVFDRMSKSVASAMAALTPGGSDG